MTVNVVAPVPTIVIAPVAGSIVAIAASPAGVVYAVMVAVASASNTLFYN
jgi:hypothetical protein